MAEITHTLEDRAAVYRALGDARRLRIVDALQHGDQPVGRLGALTGMPTNLLAFHLDVLQEAGVIARSVSEADARRRYVTLRTSVLRLLGDPPPLEPRPGARVVFVCTANSARSQLAASLWRTRTGAPARSAGTRPAARVHPGAVEVATRHGLDLTSAVPVDFRDLDVRPSLVVSVCDRAYESDLGTPAPMLHWSVPDPVPRGGGAFEEAYDRLSARIDRLARAAIPKETAP